MATYKVQDPQGNLREIEGPDGASDEDVIAQAQALFSQPEAKPSLTPEEIAAHGRKAAISSARGESPNLAQAADVAGGFTATTRGAINKLGGLFGSPEMGESVFPSEGVDKNSWSYLGGQVADPAAIGLFGGAGKVAQLTAPKLAPVFQAALAGAPAGSAVAALNDHDPLTGGAVGGVVPMLFGAFGRGAGAIYDRFSPTSKAAKVMSDATGGKRKEIIDALMKAKTGETSSHAASDVIRPEFHGLGKIAEDVSPTRFAEIEKVQEAARRGALQNVKPDLAEAIAERTRVTGPSYGRAMALDLQRREAAAETAQAAKTAESGGLFQGQITTPPVPKEIAAIADDPVIRSAAKQVKNNGQVQGNPLASLEGLHQIKIFLDSKFSRAGSPTSLANFTDMNVSDAKSKLLRAIGGAENSPGLSPAYEQARRQFAEMSAPVNQSRVIDAMERKLTGPFGERPAAFMNVLGDGEQALLKKTTGFPRFTSGDLDKVLSPGQMKVVSEIERQLIRDREISTQAGQGASAAAKIVGRRLSPSVLPNPLDAKIALTNRAIGALTNIVNKPTMDRIVSAMASPEKALEVINTLPAKERLKVLEALTNARIAPYTAGLQEGAQ